MDGSVQSPKPGDSRETTHGALEGELLPMSERTTMNEFARVLMSVRKSPLRWRLFAACVVGLIWGLVVREYIFKL